MSPYYSPRNFSPSDIFATITFASLTHTFLAAGGCAFKWSSKHGTLIISLLLLSSISLPLFVSFFFFLPGLSGAVEAANGHACQDFCFCNLWVFMSIMRISHVACDTKTPIWMRLRMCLVSYIRVSVSEIISLKYGRLTPRSFVITTINVVFFGH